MRCVASSKDTDNPYYPLKPLTEEARPQLVRPPNKQQISPVWNAQYLLFFRSGRDSETVENRLARQAWSTDRDMYRCSDD